MVTPEQNTLPQLVVLEDHTDLREEMLDYLTSRGYAVWGVGSAEALYKQLLHKPMDILLADLCLPGEDGLEVIEHIRALKRCGIIAVTARGAREERLEGMAKGADYYMVKPVDLAELEANIQALWRNLIGKSEPGAGSAVPWRLTGQGELYSSQGQRCRLSEQERQVLEELMKNPGQIVSKHALHEVLFPHAKTLDTHRVDVVVSRLRRRLRNEQIELPLRVVFGKGLAFHHDEE
ncbi:MAG: response regulator transcription factor [Saccharospirillum sp.]|nr:response regulator transcription factor [Saccharospirillum sp.]